MLERIDAIVIGAGQAGLAASAHLTRAGIDHLVLERGAVAERWRNERWASLRLLTPNWMTRLPGHAYDGPDPGGYMHKDDVTAFLTRYARRIDAPIRANAPVSSVVREGSEFRVDSGAGSFRARSVIIATGACDTPAIPAWAKHLPARIAQVTTRDYVHPGQLDPGGVLVVGASATGVQLADEIRRAGHEVAIAAGRHMPLPRSYRGRDIMAWLDAADILTEARDPSVASARTLTHPSLQLVGGMPRRDISLATLASNDVLPISRVLGAEDSRLLLSGDLGAEIRMAHERADRLLDQIDTFIDAAGVSAPKRRRAKAPTFVPNAQRVLDMDRAGIRTIVWATGFRRDYSWLRVPTLNAHGELRETGGVTECPGLYALGLPFMRKRNSSYIDGVGEDARAIVEHLAAHIGAPLVTEAA
ncbi:MAG: NAD(P)/FAD-dependent oxidoreductase [Silicimonas sp.]|nr:NAD(P)/FAD-dependent oxidoreductase [Silicimonas sp.]